MDARFVEIAKERLGRSTMIGLYGRLEGINALPFWANGLQIGAGLRRKSSACVQGVHYFLEGLAYSRGVAYWTGRNTGEGAQRLQSCRFGRAAFRRW
jgi:hypothetical protein